METIFSLIFSIDLLLLTLGYFIGKWAVDKESNDIYKGEISIELRKGERLSDEWEEKHPILAFFQCFYYDIKKSY